MSHPLNLKHLKQEEKCKTVPTTTWWPDLSFQTRSSSCYLSNKHESSSKLSPTQWLESHWEGDLTQGPNKMRGSQPCPNIGARTRITEARVGKDTAHAPTQAGALTVQDAQAQGQFHYPQETCSSQHLWRYGELVPGDHLQVN